MLCSSIFDEITPLRKLDQQLFFFAEFKSKIHFRKLEDKTFTILLFDNGACFPFNKANELNLKRTQKSNQEKVNLSLNKF